MKAYQQTITKEEFLAELKAHQKADDFVRGVYWNTRLGKGCAVGCSLESISRKKKLEINFSDHSQYPKHLGIPEWLARVEDQIFEGLPEERSKSWPVEFAEAIHTGADLEQTKGPFLVMVLKSCLDTLDHSRFPQVKAAVEVSIALWQRKDIDSEDWNQAAARAAEEVAAAARAAEEVAAARAAVRIFCRSTARYFEGV